MDRREALKRTGLLMGCSVSASAMSSILSGCSPSGTAVDTWAPSFFSPEHIDLIAEIAETILPATETPGAKDVLVHRFIDLAISKFYTSEEQNHIKSGIADFIDQCQEANGKAFEALEPTARTTFLNEMEKTSRAEAAASRQTASRQEDEKTERPRAEPTDPPVRLRPFYSYVKELTLLGYFTSEKVGEEVLTYDPIPGVAIGCMPLEEVGRVYSL